MARKTARIADIVREANRVLMLPDNDFHNAQTRAAVCNFLASILHAHGAYEGYNYLEWINGGYERWRAEGEPRTEHGSIPVEYLGDQTRRHYYNKENDHNVKNDGAMEFMFPRR